MRNNKENEPLWCMMYREQILKPKQRQRFTEQKGRTEASRKGFYTSKKWKQIRNKRRLENPLCQHCEQEGIIKPGKIIDHIIPVNEAPYLALDYDNTQHLCFKHHNIKTKEDKQAKEQRQKIERGKKLMQQFESKHR